jgi:MATE family multidrug resistance protein
MLSYSVMTLADTLFVGQLGSAALAGVGLAGTAAFALICFPVGLLRGVKVLVSQAHGAGNHGVERSFLGAGLSVGVLLSIGVIGAGLVVAGILPSLTDSAEAGQIAGSYLGVRLVSTPAVMVYVALRELRYGVGDARSPMVATVIGNSLNVGLDYLFIFVLDFGAPGAAWATVIAQAVECAVLLVAQSGQGFGLRRFTARHVRELVSTGFPMGGQFLLEVAAFSVIVVMLAGRADLEMAAHQIALQMIHFSFLPCLAIGEAAGVMSGQAVGAGRFHWVRGVSFRGLTITLAYGVTSALVFLVFRHELAGLFTEEAALLSRAAQLLLIASVFQIFDASLIVAYGALRGAGDVKVPAAMAIVCSWLFTPFLTWWLGLELGWGAVGAWIGLCLEIMTLATLLWWRLLSGRWRAAAERQRAIAAEAS